MKKRWIALALCLLMLLTMIPAAALAEERTEELRASLPQHVVPPKPEIPTPSTAPGAVLAEDPQTKELRAVVPDASTETGERAARETKIYFNASNFPDPIFREMLKDAFGRDYMTVSEAEWVRTINVTGMGISNLTGITYFKDLEKLYCGAAYDEDGNVVAKNNLSSLDIRSLTRLNELYCDNNKLTSLNLSGMVYLHVLVCSDNPSLSSLNLQYDHALGELYCGNTKVTTYKFRDWEIYGIEKLDVSNSGLSSIDVSNLQRMTWFYCENNNLTKLDLSNCEQLQYLFCYNNKLKSLDFSALEHLADVYCANNQLTSIKFKPWKGLGTLDCSNNKLTYLNLRITGFGTLCVDNNQLTDIDVSHMQQLGYLYCDNNQLTHLKLAMTGLRVSCANNQLTEIDSPIPEYMLSLDCTGNRIRSLDLSVNQHMEVLLCGDNALTSLDLSNQTELKALDCSNNRIESLDLSANTALKGLDCSNNRLCKLDLEGCPALEVIYCGGQKRSTGVPLTVDGDVVRYDFHTLGLDLARIVPDDEAGTYDDVNGILTFETAPTQLSYLYDTYTDVMMPVTLLTPYSGEATVQWTDPDIGYKGTTPYMVCTGKALTPTFALVDGQGQIIDDVTYTYTFANNTDPGSATLSVRFTGSESTCSAWFKIYLPATTATTIENVQNGISLTWKAVDGAKGYVIYRRAWNLIDGGWTDFKRWNNTTETAWTDTTVYAGTRYQYGVKAYPKDPMDNYNLGIVGPLKTTVRITTRKLSSVASGTCALTAKWLPSKVFTGYELMLATDEAFTQNVKQIRITEALTSEKRVTGLKSATTYYVRIRSYQDFEGMTYYGEWSNVIQAKTK